MKKIYLLAAMMLLSFSSLKALDPYTPPEFDPAEWFSVGEGTYCPGVFDCLGNEYPYDLPAKIWESRTTPDVFWVEVDGDAMEPFEPEKYEGDTWFDAPKPFIVYANNPEKVYTSPIWAQHQAIFCFYQQVPEIMGMLGSSDYYGTFKDNIITFPAKSYKWLTNPVAQPTSNNNGNLGLVIPDRTGVDAIEANENTPSEYYNLQGMKVASPERGNLYIVKNGKNSKKVVF